LAREIQGQATTQSAHFNPDDVHAALVASRPDMAMQHFGRYRSEADIEPRSQSWIYEFTP
jgi:hypothetical protein